MFAHVLQAPKKTNILHHLLRPCQLRRDIDRAPDDESTDVKNLHVRWGMNIKRDFKDMYSIAFSEIHPSEAFACAARMPTMAKACSDARKWRIMRPLAPRRIVIFSITAKDSAATTSEGGGNESLFYLPSSSCLPKCLAPGAGGRSQGRDCR